MLYSLRVVRSDQGRRADCPHDAAPGSFSSALKQTLGRFGKLRSILTGAPVPRAAVDSALAGEGGR